MWYGKVQIQAVWPTSTLSVKLGLGPVVFVCMCELLPDWLPENVLS